MRGDGRLTRRRALGLTVAGTVGSGLLAGLSGDPTRSSDTEREERLRVGAGRASLAWRAGARPGQVGTGDGRSVDRAPYPYTTTSEPGDGFHSEPTAKAIVLERHGERFALVKTDTYLFHEQVHRRIADLVEPLGLSRDRILVSATHNHSAPHAFSTGLVMGLFADSFDPRHWSYVTRQTATAIERAVDSLQTATVRAVEGSFDAVQENIIGPSVATEKARTTVDGLGWGTPAEYPELTDDRGRPIDAGFPPDHFDEQFVVLRFDTPDGQPIAATVTMGMHPESLDGGHGLTSEDFVGIVERTLERHVGGDFTAAYLMGALGDIEPSRGGVGKPDWWRQTFGRMEEMATTVAAEAVRLFEIAGEAEIPEGGGRVSPSDDSLADRRITGPHTPPQPLAEGEEIVLAYGPEVAVDMAAVRLTPPEGSPGPAVSYLNHEFGSGGALPATGLAFESVSPLLSAFRVGDVLLASFPGEPISDVSYNFRTRVVSGFEDVYQGYHWPENPEWVRERIAQNFSEDGLEDGYEIAAMLSMGNDSVGYYVTAWEFENRNHYRQSLTPYGAGSAEYVNGALVALARELSGGPPATTRSSLLDRVDSVRRTGTYAGLAMADESAVPVYHALVRPDAGSVGRAVDQPTDTGRFERATFTWIGGTNAVDVPAVTLERETEAGWDPVADSHGHELVVTTDQPSVLDEPGRVVRREREWTVHWEVPWDATTGRYRFSVEGAYRGVPGNGTRDDFDPLAADGTYEVVSDPLSVTGGSIPLSERFTTATVEDDQLTVTIAFEPELRAIERPAEGTTLPVTVDGEHLEATYEIEGFRLEMEESIRPERLTVEHGAYVDAAGNPTEQVDLELDSYIKEG